MLEATTRPAMVPGWWRRWPAWSPSAVMAWSVLYGALALSWAAGEGRHLRRLCAATAVRHHQAGLGPRPHPPPGGDLARWVPFLAGRRVPVALPTILGGVAALAITVGGLAFVRLAIIGALVLAPEPAEPPAYTGWATWAPGRLWPFWGIALAVATIAYDHRRHDQGRAAAGPRLGQGAPC